MYSSRKNKNRDLGAYMRTLKISMQFIKTNQKRQEFQGFSLRARLYKLHARHHRQVCEIKLEISIRRPRHDGHNYRLGNNMADPDPECGVLM